MQQSSPPSLLKAFQETVLGHVELPEQTLKAIGQMIRVKEYPRKQFVLRMGEQWNRLFYVHQGLIRLFYIDSEGREFNKAFFWEGHCIWPVSPKDRKQAVLFSVATIENAIILECSFLYLYALLQKAKKWEKFALPFAETLVEQKFQRECDFLLLSATEYFQKLCHTHPHLVSRLPDYHLASYLGITNVSLSRLKRLANF